MKKKIFKHREFIAGLLIGYIKGKEANPKPTNTTQSQLK